MFASHAVKSLPDLSLDVSEAIDWQAGHLKTLHYHLAITAVATDPSSGLLAIGTARGTIHLYGSPGVECELHVPDPPGLRVKFLQFAASPFKLVCIDEHNRIIVWDLGSSDAPKPQRITGFGHAVTALATSPSHTHAFVALASGEIKTYDLLCLRISQYTIPNLWTTYEEKSLTEVSRGTIVDIITHPRDLNLLFIAYEGGIMLVDLKEQKPVRTFELTLPPGAPGGSGYHLKEIMQIRRMLVTAMAIHPSGHLLAVGYVDGSIGFWSLEDEDKCLSLKTIDSGDDENLSQVDSVKLESVLPHGSGGMALDSAPGITTLLLPPLHPPIPSTPQSAAQSLHPDTRAAMCSSLNARNMHTYGTANPVQDFLLFPRSSPHFSGSYDPSTILIVSESDVSDARFCEAFSFPPPSFLNAPSDDDDDIVDDLADTLQSMSVSDEPLPSRLPPCLWNVLGEHMIMLDKHAHETLVRDKLDEIDGEVAFPVKGGMAWHDDEEGLMKYTKQQPRRILISRLRDLTIRFLDASPTLLVSTGPDAPLYTSFPSPIPRLTINLAPLLIDHSLGLAEQNQYDPHLTKERIEAVSFAPESLECVTVMRNQAVVLHRLDVPEEAQTFVQKKLQDEELVSLSHIKPRKGIRYSPILAIKQDKSRGPVTSVAIADIGFLAVAYTSGLLLVIDLRGPKVLLRSDSHARGGSNFLQRHSEVESINSLTWGCYPLATDPTWRVRLIATGSSGHTSVFTLTYSASAWSIASQPVPADGSSRPTGARCRADRAALAATLQGEQSADPERKCVWVSAGAKGVRTALNVNGEKIAKVDWGSKVGTVEHVEVVSRLDSQALVAYTTLGMALIYTLPHLEPIHTIQLTPSGLTDPPSTDESGDYTTHTRVPGPAPARPLASTEFRTLFTSKRAPPYAPPRVALAHGRAPVPAQPLPVALGPTSVVGSVLGYLGAVVAPSAGDQIDALHRPVPVAPAPRPSTALSPTSERGSESGQMVQDQVSARAAEVSSGIGDLANRLGTAMRERGEMLGDLQQSMNHLEEGSKAMVAQAKSLAAQQGVKRWFGF
ncbi:uncharacterized protein BXZ73DRAFT_91957 [Epithele typhae]|uniref:uncharacterized protein n=1 Tax=Epithele typhae TaxID=378194 RepID=UPI002007C8C2|nr:uncharacterized protein BXZ73DRAFT_91957 [Epithele typhae]KAH9920224.1 hypothetical protein BXZ73DRAFT_91957 [Epithele typhae]